MKHALRIGLASAVIVVAIGVAAAVSVFRRGFSARDEPSRLETWVAHAARRLAMPRAAAGGRNPVPVGAETLARARAQFADHCASCQGNDGRGSRALREEDEIRRFLEGETTEAPATAPRGGHRH